MVTLALQSVWGALNWKFLTMNAFIANVSLWWSVPGQSGNRKCWIIFLNEPWRTWVLICIIWESTHTWVQNSCRKGLWQRLNDSVECFVCLILWQSIDRWRWFQCCSYGWAKIKFVKFGSCIIGGRSSGSSSSSCLIVQQSSCPGRQNSRNGHPHWPRNASTTWATIGWVTFNSERHIRLSRRVGESMQVLFAYLSMGLKEDSSCSTVGGWNGDDMGGVVHDVCQESVMI